MDVFHIRSGISNHLEVMKLYYILKLTLWVAAALKNDVGQTADLGKCVIPN